MKRAYPFVIAALALFFQAVAIGFMHGVARVVYAHPPYSGESWEWTVSMTGLVLCAGISTALGGLGIYALLTRARLATAVALIVPCCIPALIGGAVYAYAVLVFLTVVYREWDV